MRYGFGDFVLDGESRLLLEGGREVALGPKAFELLELLIRSRPRALSRTRLRAALWPGTHVGPTSLHVLVSQLRAVLHDDAAEPRWVRTVHGFGYAFREEVLEQGSGEERSPAGEAGRRAWLSLGDRDFLLREGGSILGRGTDVAVRVDVAGVSRHHALITIAGGRATLEDLGSKNGTSVGGEGVAAPRSLRDGDVISLGRRTKLVFRQDDEDATETEGSSA